MFCHHIGNLVLGSAASNLYSFYLYHLDQPIYIDPVGPMKMLESTRPSLQQYFNDRFVIFGNDELCSVTTSSPFGSLDVVKRLGQDLLP